MTGARRPGLAGAALLAEVRAGLAVLPPGAAAVVALSGGPDSAGLAVLVTRARPDLALRAVHVRHGLRDDAADAGVAVAQAAALGLACAVVPVAVVRSGEGVEAAARAARYAALRAAARAVGGSGAGGAGDAGADGAGAGGAEQAAVLTGHTADDQAETVLLALGRGTGTRGLGGMRPARDDDGVLLVRPLLRVRREDVRAAVTVEGLPTVTDPMNHDPALRRVRARTLVLPALAGLAGDVGDPVGVLARLADLARADDDLLTALAADAVPVRAWGPVRLLAVDELGALPDALAGRVVHAALVAVRAGAGGVRAVDVDRVLQVGGGGGRVVVTGGVDAERDGPWLTLAPPGLPPLVPQSVPPGAAGAGWTVALTPLDLVLRVETGGPAGTPRGGGRGRVVPPWAEGAGARPPPARAHAGAGLPPAPAGGWAVRSPVPGDRTADGGRLAAALTAAGVPRAVRPLLPVVAPTGGGPVAWAAGVALPGEGPGAVVLVPLDPTR